jgi:Tfp pilus assembly protein PilN
MKAFNLIPAEERGGTGVGAGKSGGGAFVVLGLLGLLAIFALLYGAARHQISSRRGEVATLNAQTQAAQARATQLAPYVSFMALHEQRVQAVSQLVDSRFDWAHAFHEIGRVLPKDASLASISGTIAAASAAAATSAAPAAPATTSPSAASSTAVTSATPPGSVPTFTLSGCATSQAEVALTLDHLRLIDGVGEVTLQSSTKAAGSGGGVGGGSGGCAGSDPVFAMQVAFEPLPSVATTSSTSSTSTASASAATPATGASTGQPTTSTGGAQ